ncbi:hypothetical protein [Chitiniphilus shinanonensis]|uniref:hypothetical protein n=1 Tax=Chitiniphilus shinanonensis TaxID=553088 RepID=UPI00304A54C4
MAENTPPTFGGSNFQIGKLQGDAAGRDIVHNHASPAENFNEKDVRREVAKLLQACDGESRRMSIERISIELYRTSTFVNLSVEQLCKLRRIADEFEHWRGLDAEPYLQHIAQLEQEKRTTAAALATLTTRCSALTADLQLARKVQPGNQSGKVQFHVHDGGGARALANWRICTAAALSVAVAAATFGYTRVVQLRQAQGAYQQAYAAFSAVRPLVCQDKQGRFHAVGSVLDLKNASDMWCVLRGKASATWEEMPQPKKRSRRSAAPRDTLPTIQIPSAEERT